MSPDALCNILKTFQLEINEVTFQAISHGYINDTYLILTEGKPKYILQRLNTHVFTEIKKLQCNIDRALQKLNEKNYSEIEFIKTKENSSLAFIGKDVWRLMTYISDSKTFNTTTNSKVAFEAGRIIGTFHRLLKGELVSEYNETIPYFHHLPTRQHQFLEALKESTENLRNNASKEISYALATIPSFNTFYEENLPIRICHNDTKLNNILFDKDNNGLCLIDLDTIMPGYFHYDFGDAIRTITNEAEEDEKDLSKVSFNTKLFKAFMEGLSSSEIKLTKKEIELLPLATGLLPFLHGLRALTDYLNGNVYYKVTYSDQNLDRCRTLFQFTKLASSKNNDINNIITQVMA